MAHNWQKWKVDSLQVPAIKFIGQRQLVYLFPIICIYIIKKKKEYVKFGAIAWKFYILLITVWLKF